MKKVYMLLAPLAVFLLVLAGCGGGGNGGGGSAPQSFTDPSTTIVVDVGEEFTISLASNATTGYEWRLAEELDEDVVEQVGDPQYILEEGAEERVGAGGTEVWTFKGAGSGDTTISFEYIRPWEENEEPAETKDFDVEIT